MLHESFDSIDSWILTAQKGAQGTIQADKTHARSGKQSLKIQKTNSIGWLSVRLAEPVSVRADQTVYFRGHFHCETAPLGSLLLLRMTNDPEQVAYDAIDRTAGWVAHSLLINSPPGQWEQRIITFRAEQDMTIYPMLVIWGNPLTVWIDDLTIDDKREPIIGNPGVDPAEPFTDEQVQNILNNRSNATARVRKQNNRAVLNINDKRAAPVLYRPTPYTNIEGDYAAFAADGIDLVSCPLKLGGNHKTPGAWRGEGIFNLEQLEAELYRTLRRNPDAKIVLDLTAYPYIGWGTANPDEIWQDSSGRFGYGTWGNLEGFTDDLASVKTKGEPWFYPSYASQKWRTDSTNALKQVIMQLRKRPVFKAIVGCFILGGHDSTFQIPGKADFSPTARSAFRNWCKQKYETIENLNKQWQTQYADFDDIRVPKQGTIDEDPEAITPFISTGPTLDYRRFLIEQAWQLREQYAKAFKEAAGKPVFTLAYTGGAATHTAAPGRHTEYLDGFGTMSYYPWRKPGYPVCFGGPQVNIRNTKLFWQELDLRSWVGSLYSDVYRHYIAAGQTPRQWDAIHRKLVGAGMAFGYGHWYYDMNRYFNDPQIHKELAAAHNAVKTVTQLKPTAWRPDVAVVFSDQPAEHIGPFFSSVKSALQFQMMHVVTSGVPVDLLYLDDVLSNKELQQYKVYVFLACGQMTPSQRQTIEDRLKSDQRWLVWHYDAGYISPQGPDLKAMSDLIGIQIATEAKFARDIALTTGDSKEPLLANVQQAHGMSEMVNFIMRSQGANSFVSRWQPFFVTDNKARTLMRYRESQQVAAAARTFDQWTSVYIAQPNGISNQLLNNIAKQAGAFVAAPPGQSLHMNSRFASVHGIIQSPWRLTPPPETQTVRDAMTGQIISTGPFPVQIDLQPQQTRWFIFE